MTLKHCVWGVSLSICLMSCFVSVGRAQEVSPAEAMNHTPTVSVPPTSTHPLSVSYRQGPEQASEWMSTFFELAEQVPSKRARRALKTVLSTPEEFRFQLLITEVIGLDTQSPQFTVHEFRVDREYFYPASAIKTYASLAASIYYTELKAQHPWLTTNDALSYSLKSCYATDKSNTRGGHITLEHEIKKTQLVSKNQAFNRVFNVLGGDQIHRRLIKHFPSLRVYHRLSTNESYKECFEVPPISICDSNSRGEIHKARAYQREGFMSEQANAHPTRFDGPLYTSRVPTPYTGFGTNMKSLKIGQAYRDMHTKRRVTEPMDFSWKNRASFYDFQRLTLAIYNPDLPDPIWKENPLGKVFDRSLVRRVWLDELRHAMAIYPRHSKNPIYSSRSLSETRFKPLIRGIRMHKKRGKSVIDDASLYYLNKAGKAFGFHIDNALIMVGQRHGEITDAGRPGGGKSAERALLITVGVYANKNQMLNDNRYEYKKITVPLLDAIGYAVGRYLTR